MKKWSSFIYEFETDGKVIMLSTNSKAIVSLKKEMYTDISNTLEQGMSNPTYVDEIKQLENMKFIVDNDKNEFECFYNAVLKYRDGGNTLYITLLTTTDCNFACKYCFENDIDKSYYLNNEVVTAFISYLQYFIQNNKKINNINIELFGGEPTLSWDLVIDTLNKVNNVCERHNIYLNTSIVTNGYLFDEKKCNDLLQFNFESIQVTLDGNQDYHDKRRYTLKGEPTFDVIIRNMQDLLKLSNSVRLGIRVNCYDENILSVPDLIELLYQKIGSERVKLVFCYLEDAAEPLNNDNFSKSKFCEQLPIFNKKAKSFGFIVPEHNYHDIFCTAKINNSFVLHPKGDIYQCNVFIDKENYKLGSVFEHKPFESIFDLSLYEYCIKEKCCFLPLCHAGCVGNSFKVHGDITKIYCMKEDMEEMNKWFMLAKIR